MKSVLATRLRERRLLKKMTQKQLANLLKISEQAYGYYEQDRNDPSKESLDILAKELECTVDYLLGRTEVPNMSVSVTKTTNKDIRSLEKLREKIASGEIDEIVDGVPFSEEDKDFLLKQLDLMINSKK